MPLYEYKCRQCASVFEFLQKFSDPPLKECPKCGGPLKKVLSPPTLQFKGSGFYITDYSRKKEPEKEAQSETKPGGEKKEASKSKKDPSRPD
ncbi:MAG: zinc ribbon domain-containing protein [Candidatus Aminicenantes bacterium]|jgi:putative FmdB family regulatory protein|nr:zinc ribbon domain-containing protein [Candidatus Aminicenantes bacterium]MDH5466082.1 zinc ribbon domain-containing protein [Candidatus Aminicenantes bacterium]MDH5706024.1 zinc ribbon domain-containing protein [Candidatus Aminicenantes bacterium]